MASVLGSFLRVLTLLVAYSFANLSASSSKVHDVPVNAIASSTQQLPTGEKYPIEINVDRHEQAKHALVMIHGFKRNAVDYFKTGVSVTENLDNPNDYIVLAPQLLETIDASSHPSITEAYLKWDSIEAWESGDQSIEQSYNKLTHSSFEVFDDVILRLSDKSFYPNLENILFIGHGGGAQVIQRYIGVAKYINESHLPVGYIIANPGSYLYFDRYRPIPNVDSCPQYNDWKYGLSNVPPYVINPHHVVAKHFFAEHVCLLLGTNDKSTEGILDASCAAETQGANRYERGLKYTEYVRGKAHGHERIFGSYTVQGVGHNEALMLTSSEAVSCISNFVESNSFNHAEPFQTDEL